MKKLLLIIALIFILSTPIAFANNYKVVALISSSSEYDETKIAKIEEVLTQKGYQVDDQYLDQVVSDFGYVNTDKSRAKDLISAMLDDKIDIIWFVRGGAGAFNLMPALYAAKDKLKTAKPKILVGFSDVTALHYFVNNTLRWPSVHGVLAAPNKDMKDVDNKNITVNDLQEIPSIKKLFTKGTHYKNIIPLNDLAKKGIKAPLVGGNLTVLQSFFSTEYEKDLAGKILLLEDVGTSFRQLDRTLHQLLFDKTLHVKGIIFGQFYPLDPTDEQRLIYKTVIENFAKKYNKPVYYYPYFGHGRKNVPFVLTKNASLVCPKNDEYCYMRQKNNS